MGARTAFGNPGQAGRRRTMRRKEFLGRMEGLVPWGTWPPPAGEAY